jgi:hypothetical protein
MIACIDSNGTVPESGPADEPPGPDEDDPTPPGVVRSWFGVKEHTTEGIGSDQRNVEDEASLSRSAAFVNCHVQASLSPEERKFNSFYFSSGLAPKARLRTQVTRHHAAIFDDFFVWRARAGRGR